MTKKKVHSVEAQIAHLGNSWLDSYGISYVPNNGELNFEIDNALSNYFSKTGGKGGNYPDVKLIRYAESTEKNYPVLIEYKGYKDKLIKLDEENKLANSKKGKPNEPNLTNIKGYAVNGAVHYANAILHYTTYSDVIAIGMTGYVDEQNKLRHKICVYYVSKESFGLGQEVGEYSDLSFLDNKNFNNFAKKIESLKLPKEKRETLKEQREREIDASITQLNNDVYKHEEGLGEDERVYLVIATIIATLGAKGVVPLDKSELKSQIKEGNRDGDIIYRKIESFLKARKIREDKCDLILGNLKGILTGENINKPYNGESQLKRVFIKVFDSLGIYYKIGLTTDFTGKLFNEMYNWFGFSQDKLNDVVLTPPYVATLLARLARVNKDSYVWDFATGSAGLLVAAMNEMIDDAKENIKSPKELEKKIVEIKANQLLGIERLQSIYMLAVLNMILMGDGSSNIINTDSLKDYKGDYGYTKENKKFPATAFVLNPPYSADGNGMVFVERALSKMNKGYAAIIIQDSSGSGKAIEYNRRILKENTLLASIKMPVDLFIGKSSVQTYVYVFRVNEPHQKDDIVKFIDFSYDGYARSNRKKAHHNLYDVDNAKERYKEVVDLVRFGKEKLHFYTEKEYFEGHIDPKNGADWNQSAPLDVIPKLEDFQKTVVDYLSFKITTLMRNASIEGEPLEK